MAQANSSRRMAQAVTQWIGAKREIEVWKLRTTSADHAIYSLVSVR